MARSAIFFAAFIKRFSLCRGEATSAKQMEMERERERERSGARDIEHLGDLHFRSSRKPREPAKLLARICGALELHG